MDISQFTGKRTDLIAAIIGNLEDKVAAGQRVLLNALVDDFLDELDTNQGLILNTLKNKRLLTLFDQVFTQYGQTTTLEIVKTVIDSVQQIINFNANYFDVLAPKTQLAPIKTQVQQTIDQWLGIDDKGKIVANGYLDTLIYDDTVRNNVRNIVVKDIISQNGYNATKANLKTYITGDNEVPGAMQKYYRNFVFDTFSVVDRANSQIYAEALDFNFAIYEGGIIKTTRPFCRTRNGKVFSRDEIMEFGNAEPPPAKPPGYNPITDLGGYGCRHHLNWVPDNVAFTLRPDLKGK